MREPQETRVRSLNSEDPLEKEVATHSSILAWEILWTEESGGPWGHKELDMTERTCAHTHTHTHTHTQSSNLNRLQPLKKIKLNLFIKL